MCAHSECAWQGREYEAAPFGDLVITITHAKGLKEISEIDKHEAYKHEAYCVITLVGTDYKYQTQTLVNVGEQGTPFASFTSFTSTKAQLLTQKSAALWNETVTWKDVYKGYENLRVQVWEVISHFLSRMRKQQEV